MTAIETRRFENAIGVADALLGMQRTAKTLEKTITEPVVYVLGPDGTQFSKAVLFQEKLTDGSVVYNIELRA